MNCSNDQGSSNRQVMKDLDLSFQSTVIGIRILDCQGSDIWNLQDALLCILHYVYKH